MIGSRHHCCTECKCLLWHLNRIFSLQFLAVQLWWAKLRIFILFILTEIPELFWSMFPFHWSVYLFIFFPIWNNFSPISSNTPPSLVSFLFWNFNCTYANHMVFCLKLLISVYLLGAFSLCFSLDISIDLSLHLMALTQQNAVSNLQLSLSDEFCNSRIPFGFGELSLRSQKLRCVLVLPFLHLLSVHHGLQILSLPWFCFLSAKGFPLHLCLRGLSCPYP